MQKQKTFFKAIVLFNLSFAAYSCSPVNSASVNSASQQITQSLGCADMKSLVFDSFYEMIDQDQAVPSASAMKESLQTKMQELQAEKNFSQAESATLAQITTELGSVIDLMLAQTPDMTSESWKEQIQQIIRYEMQNESTPEITSQQKAIHQSLATAKKLADDVGMACQIDAKAISGKAPESQMLLNRGGDRVIATAYQSCRVLDLPAMDLSTPAVSGITRLAQNHPDGIGGKRVVSNLKSLQSTHYYLKGIATEASCLAVRETPLIYDYGGQAAVSGSTLNFFKNAGSGTEALGVDCSAFVSAAVAVAGFRYQPGLENKPIYTRQGSSEFIDAASSKFTCFDNVTVTAQKSIQPGDIMAVRGHVVLIDRIGQDPFGLAFVKTESGCSSMDYKNFDFDISQSDPSKNGIGINKYKVKDYITDHGSGKMKTGFVEMAKNACLAKFQNKSIKPKSSAWGYIRHKGTPECLAPRVSLVGESCTQKCF